MSKPGSGRWVRFGLLVLAVVPVAAGATRLFELAGGPPVLPINPRIAGSPAPAVIHITSGALYLLAGILQSSTAFRRRWPRGHVRAGRLLAVLGLAVAASAIWMTLFYPREAGRGVCTTSSGLPSVSVCRRAWSSGSPRFGE